MSPDEALLKEQARVDIKESIWKIVKLIIEYDETENDRLSKIYTFAIDTVIDDVLDYCNLDILEWETALTNIAASMVMDKLSQIELLKMIVEANTETGELGGDVKTLKEGDFSITQETAAEAYQKLSKLKPSTSDYRQHLNKYRKLAR